MGVEEFGRRLLQVLWLYAVVQPTLNPNDLLSCGENMLVTNYTTPTAFRFIVTNTVGLIYGFIPFPSARFRPTGQEIHLNNE